MGKRKIAKYYPLATLTVREDYGHCQYMSFLGARYGAFCDYGVAVSDFQHPVFDWNRNNIYIQSRATDVKI